VSHVTNVASLFRDERDFKEDISAWDTSNVTSMRSVFSEARAFKQPIGGWEQRASLYCSEL